MQHKTDAQILAEAREYMEQNGRTTGTMCNDDGMVCALGAISYSQGLGYLSEEDLMNPDFGLSGAVTTLAKTVVDKDPRSEVTLDSFSSDYVVVRFNDHVCPEEEHDQMVLDAFAKAEKIALNGGVDPDA